MLRRSRCRSCAAWRISRLVSVNRRPTSTSDCAISPIRARFASRTASVAFRLSLPAVRFIASKLSMIPLVADAVFSLSARPTAVARSSAVFSVSLMMPVNDFIRLSSSSARALSVAEIDSSAGLRSSTDVWICRLASSR